MIDGVPEDIITDGKDLWVSVPSVDIYDQGYGTSVVKINPITKAIEESYEVGNGPQNLLLDGEKLWVSRTFYSWLSPKRNYILDTNFHGEERAYVMTGQYEKVLPMNIYLQQLIKACMIQDIELMENLGIYEISEEDVALCEFVCTSKIDVQNIIRDGLDLIKKECC